MKDQIINAIVKGLLKGAAKAAPSVISKIMEKRYDIATLTGNELVRLFLRNPNRPQCTVVVAALDIETVLRMLQNELVALSMQTSRSVSVDGWAVLIGQKNGQFIFFRDKTMQKHAQTFQILVRALPSGCEVVLGHRFTDASKIDIFRVYQKASIKKIGHMARLISDKPSRSITGLD